MKRPLLKTFSSDLLIVARKPGSKSTLCMKGIKSNSVRVVTGNYHRPLACKTCDTSDGSLMSLGRRWALMAQALAFGMDQFLAPTLGCCGSWVTPDDLGFNMTATRLWTNKKIHKINGWGMQGENLLVQTLMLKMMTFVRGKKKQINLTSAPGGVNILHQACLSITHNHLHINRHKGPWSLSIRTNSNGTEV